MTQQNKTNGRQDPKVVSQGAFVEHLYTESAVCLLCVCVRPSVRPYRVHGNSAFLFPLSLCQSKLIFSVVLGGVMVIIYVPTSLFLR